MNHKIRLILKSYDPYLIDRSAQRICKNVKPTGATINGPMPMPTKIKKFTVLRSPHVYKKSREQFQQKVHKRLIDIYSSNPKAVDELMKLELPAGIEIAIKV